ncbi:hypothetical protein [Agrobacterium tumefaciens]|uniref:hypothetical protein n=1 Tax=Agrobacterium tumefaciens TaxID=358 RepID=UPI001573CA80|nr:hypothetical protein [Agrobacterium tumefaciens]NTE37632.1 hypothetical protein [Agrobacterium tumefaciens]NTE53144.1 hypothetical protein [Agrobacterium tumefaciens]
MPNPVTIAKSPAVRAGLIIPGAVMMILFAVSALPFWSVTAVALINTLALATGLLGGLSHVMGVMPPALAIEEIQWRKRYPQEYGEEDWEMVPFLHSFLVRLRAADTHY